MRYAELNQELGDPEVVADPRRYRKTAKAHSDLGEIVAKFDEYRALDQGIRNTRSMLHESDEDPEMKAMAEEELASLEQRLGECRENLKLLLLPKDPNDERNVIIERVPATESSGRIHTSAVTVAVLPEADEVEVAINEKDLRIDTFCSSGPGGQSVNTTYSAVRITHLPTGLVVSCQDEKSQIKNRAQALRVLRSRLYELELEKQQQAVADERRSMVGSGDRSGKMRTYNYPQNRVTDHRIGLTLHRLEAITSGDLDELIDALFTHFQAERLKKELVA